MPESPSKRSPRQMPYLTVVDTLKREIEEGMYDSKFPSEGALVIRFGMARMTIRRALDVLREQGLITTRMGKGSTVVPAADRPASDMK
ncbi:GntR family transcriptional regulator [Kitasatospora aureofaciens]|uniref:GntR family transcriptional regulator n=1 Tax=Kitasatospora aureofaciens TaxID=1894 RepID=UPI0033E7F587